MWSGKIPSPGIHELPQRQKLVPRWGETITFPRSMNRTPLLGFYGVPIPKRFSLISPVKYQNTVNMELFPVRGLPALILARDHLALPMYLVGSIPSWPRGPPCSFSIVICGTTSMMYIELCTARSQTQSENKAVAKTKQNHARAQPNTKATAKNRYSTKENERSASH